MAAADDKARARELARDSEPDVEPPKPEPGPIAKMDVRVGYTPLPKSSDVVLVPAVDPDEEISGERPAHADDEFPAEPTAPRSAAAALPPRNRKALARIDQDTPPRARLIDQDADDEDTSPSSRERDARNFRARSAGSDKRPSSIPQPDLSRPLFEQEWSATAQGTPTWRPGAPPVDATPSRDNWYVVGTFALLGVGLIVLWLWWWT